MTIPTNLSCLIYRIRLPHMLLPPGCECTQSLICSTPDPDQIFSERSSPFHQPQSWVTRFRQVDEQEGYDYREPYYERLQSKNQSDGYNFMRRDTEPYQSNLLLHLNLRFLKGLSAKALMVAQKSGIWCALVKPISENECLCHALIESRCILHVLQYSLLQCHGNNSNYTFAPFAIATCSVQCRTKGSQ